MRALALPKPDRESLGPPKFELPLALAAVAVLASWSCARPAPEQGLRLVSADQQGAVARAGLGEGDVVLSVRAAAGGGATSVGSCRDWWRAELSLAPRGALQVFYWRDGVERNARLGAGEWRAEGEPIATESADRASCALWSRAMAAFRGRQWVDAAAALEQLEAEARARQDTDLEAQAALGLGQVLVAGQRLDEGEVALTRASALLARLEPNSLLEAQALHLLGRLSRLRGRLDEAEETLLRAEAIRARLAPDSLERSYTLNNLGIVAFSRGDLATAEARYHQSLALVRAASPGSEDEAQMLANLGLVRRELEDLAGAEVFCREAYEISLRRDPEGAGLGRDLVNLAAIVADRGELARSADLLWEALARFEKLEPESPSTAHVLFNLGINLRDRGELARAEEMLRRAHALRRKLAPGSLAEAKDLSSLSWVVAELGRPAEAEDLARQALALRRAHSNGGLEHASGLGTLSQVLMRRGQTGQAFALAEDALAMLVVVAPETRQHAFALETTGNIALEAGRLGRARQLIEASIELRQRIQPGHQWLANSYSLLGRLETREGNFAKAEAAYLEALAIAEEQGGRVGRADETVARFHGRLAQTYGELVTVQIRAGRPDRALTTLERSRGRSLLSQLSLRDLTWGGDLPAELAAEQLRLNREWERVRRRAGGAGGESVGLEIERLRGERARLTERIAASSPRLAALRHPRPLDSAAAREVLDPGTVWLSYAVGAESSWLFALGARAAGPAGELRVFELPWGEAALRRELRVLKALLLLGRERPEERSALDASRERLTEMLLVPAEEVLGGARRLMISPDGPLHGLPFGLLPPPGHPSGYLIERWPIHQALSATVFAELRRGRWAKSSDLREPGGGRLAVFADPAIRASREARLGIAPSLRERYAAGLPPLPAGRLEAEALEGLFGGRATLFLGAKASETRLRGLGAATRWLHFAGHALLDERSPLESALALATPKNPSETDNGLLEAWEIFDQLRLPLELVTLSACDTGLGEEAGGEGLLGLSRAFQYAGARSVVASLWPVSDASTARFMRPFYAALAAGANKDQALAAAQRELIETAHPYHWAAFVLMGDWQ